MRPLLLPLLPLLALTQAACGLDSDRGFVHVETRNPVVTVGGGTAGVGGSHRFHVWYFVDRDSHTCWMEVGPIGGPIDCCRARLVREAERFVTWEDDASCQGRVGTSAGAGAPNSSLVPPAW